MKKSRSRYHHGDLRKSALEAAVAELDQHGHAAFTLERLAKRLGVTAPALYRHFKNRDAILRAVIWEVFLRFVARVDAAVLSTDDPVLRLRRMGDVYVSFALENPGWFRLQFSREAKEEHQVPHADAEPKYPEALFAALRQLFPTGTEAEVQQWFLLLWAAAHGAAALAVEQVFGHVNTPEERKAQAVSLLDRLVDSIEAASKAGTGRASHVAAATSAEMGLESKAAKPKRAAKTPRRS